jgi:hypothetical protein
VGRQARMRACLMDKRTCMHACGMDKRADLDACGVNRCAYVHACGLNNHTLGARMTGEKLIFFNVFYGQYG